MAYNANSDESVGTGPAWGPAADSDLGSGSGFDLIVVGFDGSDEAALALRWAAELVHRSSSQLRVVWAWEMTDVWAEALAAQDDLLVPPITELENLARRRLTQQVETLIGGFVLDVVIDPVQGADAAAVLLGAATDADVLVVGSRGHGRVANALVGSVSARCIREAHCPVLVIPHPMVTRPAAHIDPRTVQAEVTARHVAPHRRGP